MLGTELLDPMLSYKIIMNKGILEHLKVLQKGVEWSELCLGDIKAMEYLSLGRSIAN